MRVGLVGGLLRALVNSIHLRVSRIFLFFVELKTGELKIRNYTAKLFMKNVGLSQLKGLIVKQILLLVRQTRTIIFQLVFPLLVIGFLFGFSEVVNGLVKSSKKLGEWKEYRCYSVSEQLNLFHEKYQKDFVPYSSNHSVPFQILVSQDSQVGEEVLGHLDFSNYEKSTGLLGDIPQQEVYSKITKRKYFIPASQHFHDEEEINGFLWKRVEKGYLENGKAVKKNKDEWNRTDIIGSIHFQQFEGQIGSILNFTVQGPTDCRPLTYMYRKLPSIVRRRVDYRKKTCKLGVRSALLNMISNAYNKYMGRKEGTNQEDYFIQANLAKMPHEQHYDDLTILLTSDTTGFALSMLFPLPFFLYPLVLEKSNKMRELLKINRMKLRYYWLANIIVISVFYTLQNSLLYIMGSTVFKIHWVVNTSVFVLAMFQICANLSMVAMTVFFQSFFVRLPNVAVVAMYIFVLLEPAFGGIIESSFISSSGGYSWLMLFPPFAIHHFLATVSRACRRMQCVTFHTGFLHISGGVFSSMIFLVLDSVLLFCLGFYIDGLTPKWGQKRSIFYFIDPLKRWIMRNRRQKSPFYFVLGSEEETEMIDSDVLAERSKVERILGGLEGPQTFESGVVVHGISKKYHGVNAVDGVSFHVPSGELFGLVGPNGAGKTTLCSILSGLISATKGEAFISGRNVKLEMTSIRNLKISLCPQYEILWEDLTVSEHLYFFSRMKGVHKKDIDAEVTKITALIGLDTKKKSKASQLSGGMKKRLALGISLCGSPQLIILDEPTTGLDPIARRRIWDVLLREKAHRTIIITTHSLDEADIICDRIGILTDGRLRAIGSSMALKNRFGSGYKIHINHEENGEEKVRGFMKEKFPMFVEVMGKFSDTLVFQPMEKEGVEVSNILKIMEENKKESGVKEYSVNHTTLKDVFMHLVNNEE